ncbi:MAG: DUF3440 domain-containing protein [Caulobacteraceae bacterium]|nr:DUF3440 domain-containing protein [Caulobacteraceae bacterium]
MPAARKRKQQSLLKVNLGMDVLTAARQRIATVFDAFPRIYVSFSGGKDSAAMLHLVMEEAVARGRKVGVLFVDWEAQYQLTIAHVAECLEMYRDNVEVLWSCLPLKTTNACSQHEPEWICWQPEKRAIWVRQIPEQATMTSDNPPSFYRGLMTFEEFVPAVSHWYGQGQPVACFVGIRSDESLNRFRSFRRIKSRWQDRCWTTWLGQHAYNAYPIYDWKTEDVWTYFGRSGKPYNRLYDLMHKAGLSIHQQRICEPYGDEQRKGLWLYHLVEPKTWTRIVQRVAGVNSGSLYAKERGNILGNQRIDLPKGHTWKSYARFLLDTMPGPTAEHYRTKIARYVNYCTGALGYLGDIPDHADGDTGGKDIPSWRRVCRCLLRNDYWCYSLSFSATKSAAYEKYMQLMKIRRNKWGIM